MMKAPLTALSVMAVMLTLTGAAHAAQTGHLYTRAASGDTDASTTWVYSSLCKAAVPVTSPERQAEVIRTNTPMKGYSADFSRVQEHPLVIYGSQNYDYAP